MFEGLSSSSFRRRGLRALVASWAVHAGLIGAVLALPVLLSEPLPEPDDQSLRIFFYYHDSPPPPPPPPLGGRGLVARPVRAPTPPSAPRETPLAIPSAAPEPAAPRAEAVSPDEAGGQVDGTAAGHLEGMEGGVVGGEVGGVPGGVVGGVLGGRGQGPVLPVPVAQPDTQPRLLLMTRPRYPQDAFTQKVEGTVLLEILIDEHGRVIHCRVLRSVRLLDAAAMEAVQAWRFVPARHGGREVAALAQAPVTFRIF